MRADLLEQALAGRTGPTIVCAQAGNVNTGACDPLPAVADACAAAGAWLHVDGAFGLWAAASPRFRHLVDGAERADSWATDAHKWLNVPYDCGLVFTRHPEAHGESMAVAASYLQRSDGRSPADWVPESSRRARGFAVWAALRSLGRRGVTDLVERCCDHAQAFAELLAVEPGAEILNDVVLNQVLVRFGDDDETTQEVVRRVQEDGTCWLGGTIWQGRGRDAHLRVELPHDGRGRRRARRARSSKRPRWREPCADGRSSSHGRLCSAVPRVARGAADSCLSDGRGATTGARWAAPGRADGDGAGGRGAHRERGARHRRNAERPVLRFRHRRRGAGRPCRRLADVDVGSERGPRCGRRRARRLSRRSRSSGCSSCSAYLPARLQVWLPAARSPT